MVMVMPTMSDSQHLRRQSSRIGSPAHSPAQSLGGGGGGNSDHEQHFIVDHLATFEVDRGAAQPSVVYPADGMRKLLQLEKTTGIWSQRMEIVVIREQRLLIIRDHDTKQVRVERF